MVVQICNRVTNHFSLNRHIKNGKSFFKKDVCPNQNK
jgi:hypothetical protein